MCSVDALAPDVSPAAAALFGWTARLKRADDTALVALADGCDLDADFACDVLELGLGGRWAFAWAVVLLAATTDWRTMWRQVRRRWSWWGGGWTGQAFQRAFSEPSVMRVIGLIVARGHIGSLKMLIGACV